MQVKSHSGRNHHDQTQSSPSSAYTVVGLQMSDAFYLFLCVVDKIYLCYCGSRHPPFSRIVMAGRDAGTSCDQLTKELAKRFGYESFKSPLQEKAVVAVHGGRYDFDYVLLRWSG